jgi:hypothetical protein
VSGSTRSEGVRISRLPGLALRTSASRPHTVTLLSLGSAPKPRPVSVSFSPPATLLSATMGENDEISAVIASVGRSGVPTCV